MPRVQMTHMPTNFVGSMAQKSQTQTYSAEVTSAKKRIKDPTCTTTSNVKEMNVKVKTGTVSREFAMKYIGCATISVMMLRSVQMRLTVTGTSTDFNVDSIEKQIFLQTTCVTEVGAVQVD